MDDIKNKDKVITDDNYEDVKDKVIITDDNYEDIKDKTDDDYKSIIQDMFDKNIKGKKIEVNNKKRCGEEGQYLEKLMGLSNNCKNEPDLYGYEMKKYSNKMITLGDFSASEYAFSKTQKRPEINKINGDEWNNLSISRVEFIHFFGTFKEDKNRYSWSGSCVPKYNEWNDCGQILEINNENDILIYYSYEKDKRTVKENFPPFLKKDKVLIAIWKSDKIEKNVNKKFNINGFYTVKKDKNGVYQDISFGKQFDFHYFIESMKNKKIIFDSGMYEGNSRNYSQFRGGGEKFWKELEK